jgi:hypothetical protein
VTARPPEAAEPEARVRVVPAAALAGAREALFAPRAAGSALVVGDAREVLAGLPGGIFQTCVTSPPYW